MDYIKWMSEEYYEAIPNVYAKSFQDQPWEDDWYQIEAFNPPSNWIYLQREETKGFILSFLSKGMPYISVLAVSPEVQGQGVGRMLIERVENYWKDGGYSYIRIHVAHERERAKRLYEHLGYQVVKDDGEDYEMKKIL